MNTIEKIRQYILKNGYSGHGLTQHLTNTGADRRYKATLMAATTTENSGIVKYRGRKYGFYAIAPWACCPDGQVTVELV